MDADVLLVDEVLAVGDAAFQQKCFEEFDRLKAEGRTIVFVTHDMASVERFCDRAHAARAGRMVDIGDPEEVSRAYSELNFGGRAASCDEQAPGKPFQIVGVWCEDADGSRIVTQQQGQRCRACWRSSSPRPWGTPLGIEFRNEARHPVFAAHSAAHWATGTSRPVGERWSPSRSTTVGSGRYDLSAAVGAPPAGRGGRGAGPRRGHAVVGFDVRERRRRGHPARAGDQVGMSGAAQVLSAPSALGTDLRRFASLTYLLAVTDFKLNFFGSFLGYLWGLMRPLMLFGVLYVVFTQVIKFGEGVKHYPVYLLTSIMLMNYFGETTGGGVTSLIKHQNLLRKMQFPRLVIPLSVALTALFNLGLNLIAVFFFAMVSGVERD